MKRIGIAVLLLALLAGFRPVMKEVLFSGAPRSSGANSTPMGDTIPLASYWSPGRCATNATNNKKIADIVDASTGTTTETVLICNTGNVIVASVTNADCTIVGTCSPLATTCAVSCVIATIFDQVGTTNLTNATNSARPFLLLNGVSNRNVMQGTGSQRLLLASGTPNIPKPNTTIGTAFSATSSANQPLFSSNSGAHQLSFNVTADQAFFFGGTAAITQSAIHGIWHQATAIQDATGANSFVYVDGVAGTSGNAGSFDINNGDIIMNNSAATFCTCLIGEIALASNNISSSDAATISTNSKIYFGY